MADTTEEVERKPRKSVAFSEGATIMDANGEVTEAPYVEKNTAESHTADKDVDEVTELFKGLSKKKKTKKPKEDGDAEEGDEAAPAADGELDLSAMKKKKKKPKKVDVGDFDAKLAEAGVTEEGGETKEAAGDQLPEGDLEKGTGIWAQDCTQAIPYQLLASRFFSLIQSHHPDLLSSGSKSYRIPPPQCLREGNRRTIFANIADICKRMKRSDDHVMQFLFAELGTSGSVDGSRRLVIKGRFQQKQIENVLRRYIVEYVTCKTCRSPDTELNKGENRLYFVTCNSCGSRRSVTAIKTGFRGQVGRRKKAA
jgi:translation initiation factor 2 subunit 2